MIYTQQVIFETSLSVQLTALILYTELPVTSKTLDTNSNTNKWPLLKQQKHAKAKPKPAVINTSYMCVCTTVT